MGWEDGVLVVLDADEQAAQERGEGEREGGGEYGGEDGPQDESVTLP